MERSVQVRTMNWSIDPALLPDKPTPGRLVVNGSSIVVEIPRGRGWVVAGELRGPQAQRLIALLEKKVKMHAVIHGKTVAISWRS